MVDKNYGEQVLTKTRTAQDPEIAAMSKIARLLGELSDSDRASVVAWVGRKYAAPTVTTSGGVTFGDGPIGQPAMPAAPVKR